MKTMKYLSAAIAVLMMTGCADTAVQAKEGQERSASAMEGVEISFTEEELDEQYDEKTAVKITFSGNSAAVDGNGAEAANGTVTITKGGTYVLSGSGENVNVVISAKNDGSVHLVLNGITLTSSTGPAIYVSDAEETILTAVTGTKNVLSASGENADEKKGGIFTKDDLVINGGGSLEITAAAGDGIHANDALKVVNAMITIHAESDGIDVNEQADIKDCILNITVSKDGINAGDEDEDTGKVTVSDIQLSGGVITVNAEDDGIQATGNVIVSGTEINVTAGGGYENAAAHTGDIGGFGGHMGQEGMGGFPFGGMNGNSEDFTSGATKDIDENFSGQGPQNGGMMPPEGNEFGQGNGFGRGGRREWSNGEMPQAGSGFSEGNADGMPRSGFNVPGNTQGELPQNNEPSDNSSGSSSANSENNTSGSSVSKDSRTQNSVTAGTTSSEEESEASKGIKADGSIKLDQAVITVNSTDDAFNAGENVTVSGGAYTVKAGDDGVHADLVITIESGEITIAESYEGLEAKNLVIEDGTISISASDDGINTVDQSSNAGDFESDDSMLTINGGTVTVDADGDGIDCNGNAVMNGGTVTVYGPENSGNGALDYAGTFTVNGGTLLTGGSSGMAMTPSESSKVNVIHLGVTDTSGAVEVKDASGSVIVSYQSDKKYNDLVIASDAIKTGSSYTIYENGSKTEECTISSTITSVNAASGMGPGGFGGFGGRGQRENSETDNGSVSGNSGNTAPDKSGPGNPVPGNPDQNAAPDQKTEPGTGTSRPGMNDIPSAEQGPSF